MVNRGEALLDGLVALLGFLEPVLRLQLLEPEPVHRIDHRAIGHDISPQLGEPPIAASISRLASSDPQSAGPTSRPISRPSRSISSVVGMPTAFTAANNLPEESV